MDKQIITKKAADYVVSKCKGLGFQVMRYDAYSSNSVYLKLDDGVVGTIRISDHRGKKHLRYKYNLIKGCYRHKRNDKGIDRYFFPMSDIEILIEKLVYDRQVLKDKYGENYGKYMRMNRERGQEKNGFWRKAQYV